MTHTDFKNIDRVISSIRVYVYVVASKATARCLILRRLYVVSISSK